MDGATEGGQTPLMLASISGLSEVVRLLLGAGADVQIKDRLGLTAMDWSKRRGFPEIAELLANSAKRDAVPAQPTVAAQKVPSESVPAHTTPELAAPKSEEPGGPAKREDGNGEKERPRLDYVARIQALFDQLRVSEESLAPSQDEIRKPQPDELKLRQERLKAEDERISRAPREKEIRIPLAQVISLRPSQEQEATATEPVSLRPSQEQEATITQAVSARPGQEQNPLNLEQERRSIEAERAANELAREKSRLETERIAEESRKRVEGEVRKTHLRKTRIITQDIWPVEPVNPVALTATTPEPSDASPLKRCPKCNASFKGESCTNCASESVTLIGAPDSSFRPHPANVLARPTVWMLMAITLAGGVFIGYQLNDYVAKKDERPSASIAAAPVEQPVSAKPEVPPVVTPNLPLVGGALSGAEASIPEPEYPARAKSEGVSDTITVRVRVNNRGRVILARSSTGDWRLRAAAVQAAKKATFLPEKLAADERFVSGTITYTFKP